MGAKVFGVGMPRTGTASLHHALQVLGYRSGHNLMDPVTVDQLRRGDYRLKALDELDAVSDIPIPAIFAQLDEAFPGQKFVLTVRDVDSWIESHRRVAFNAAGNVPKPGSTRAFYRSMLYGCEHFSEQRFRWVFDQHNARVRDHFAGSDRLLVMDMNTGFEWEPLCRFLGVDVPDVPYPVSNRSEGAKPSKRSRVSRLLRPS